MLANTDNFIYQMLQDICNPTNFTSGLTQFLTQSLMDINPTVTNSVIDIMKGAVFSIGAALLVIFMLMELVGLMSKISTDNSQLRGIQIPANIIIKFAIIAFLFCHQNVILDGIQGVATYIADSVNWDRQINTDTQADVDKIYDLIEKENIFAKMWINTFLMLAWIILKGIQLFIHLNVTIRLFELWIMLALAPIPLSTIASQEFRGVCFNFLKTFAAISLQSTVILLCFKIYGLMVTSTLVELGDYSSAFSFLDLLISNSLKYLFVLGLSILGSSRLAKSIIQAQ